MELAELTEYARRQYHTEEEFPWKDFPGFSVLRHPQTGKWIALLMRQWDGEAGRERQWCDIKCGASRLSGQVFPFLSAPLRMKGEKWTGVTMNAGTDRAVVFSLLDRAVAYGQEHGYTVVLEENPAQTPAGQPARSGGGLSALTGRPGIYKGVYEMLKARQEDAESNRLRPSAGRGGMTAPRPEEPGGSARFYRDTPLPPPGRPSAPAGTGGPPAVPEKLREMRRMYSFGRESYADKSRSFLRQARFMADYEDSEPWNGSLFLFLPTYQDLTTRQLRGYFTWRAQVRRGVYGPAPEAFGRLYVYELINGIGAASAPEALAAMDRLREAWLDADGSAPDARRGLRKDIRNWMFELAVVKGLPEETVRQYADAGMLARDDALAVLRDPPAHTDEAVYDALCAVDGGRHLPSPVTEKEPEKGKRLFAGVWRAAAASPEGDVFADCFGNPEPVWWHPLAAVPFDEPLTREGGYTLGPCRRYECQNGHWREIAYSRLHYNSTLFFALLREADRQLRRYLKTGRYLKERPEEAWAAPFVRAAVEAEEKAAAEAARPVVTLDLSGLDRIRQDAAVTRESLLTAEDLRDAAETREREAGQDEAAALPGEGPADRLTEEAGDLLTEEAPRTDGEPEETPAFAQVLPEESVFFALDPLQAEILRLLLAGEPAGPVIAARRLMPEVEADEINEALFDEIGDSCVVCEGGTLMLVEDYRDDVVRIVGGIS